MKIKRLCAGVLLFALLGMTACSGTAKLEGRLLQYDLGEGTLQDSTGRSVPYRIQGVLGIPDGQNRPIVVLVHGAHPIEKASEDRYDTGFNYLTRALSEQGNLVISMNVGINYSFENGEPNGNERTQQIFAQQMELLKKAIAGDKKVFGYDLAGVGDLKNVILMGHSRGGLDVIELAAKAMPDIGVAGIVSLAPSTYKTIETELPDVPIGIIIPQLDGDVISMDGNDIYESIVVDEQYTKTAELIYLKSANHGHFNTQLTQPDLNSSKDDIAKLMPAEAQRSFLVNYMSDFVRSVTTEKEPVFASARKLEASVYNCDVLLRVHSGTGTLLYSAQDGISPSSESDTVIDRQIESFYPEKNTMDTFKMPGAAAFEEYALEHISWNGKNNAVTVPLAKSLSGSRFLDIDMAVDSSDLRNMNGQSMTLSVRDESGKTAALSLDRFTAALLWQEGELLEVMGWDNQLHNEYTTFTPLVTLRIDLSKLSGVDLGKIESLTMSWPDSIEGSIMLRSIYSVE